MVVVVVVKDDGVGNGGSWQVNNHHNPYMSTTRLEAAWAEVLSIMVTTQKTQQSSLQTTHSIQLHVHATLAMFLLT